MSIRHPGPGAHAPWFELEERLKRISAIFRAVLRGVNRESVFDERQIHVQPEYVCEFTSRNEISEAILSTMFPREPSPAELDHYTTFDAFKGIVAAGKFRLYSLAKRLSEDEFTTFAREHDLQGYFNHGTMGVPFYEELANDLFYSSFTRPGGSSEGQLWRDFGGDGKGVRLRFRVSPGAADLRPMQYKTGSDTLLKKLNDALSAQEGVVFVPWTLSKIAAFYLSLGYKDENEVRLIIKRYRDGINRARKDKAHEYWPVPISAADEFCRLDLLSITCGSKINRSAVDAILAGTRFEGVRIDP